MILLKGERIKAGLSQIRLSEISGVPQQTISSIESGKRTNPSIETLFKLAQALGTTIDRLYTQEAADNGEGAAGG